MEGSDRQNVTLSLPRELLRRLRHMAVDQGTSLSGMIVRLLEQAVPSDESYTRAMERQVRLMHHGFELGSRGHASWMREELHER